MVTVFLPGSAKDLADTGDQEAAQETAPTPTVLSHAGFPRLHEGSGRLQMAESVKYLPRKCK